MIIICCVAKKAMVDIFETWNPSNLELCRGVNWSLSTNPYTNWDGVYCLQPNQSTDPYTHTNDVSGLRIIINYKMICFNT